MISRIVVSNLYGIHTYDIELKNGGVTILTGPNGYGKTTILNIINAIHSCDFYFLCQLIFESIQVYYSLREDKQMIVSITKPKQEVLNEDSESEVSQISNPNKISVSLINGADLKVVENFNISVTEKRRSRTNPYGNFRMRFYPDEEITHVVDEDRSKTRNFRMFMEQQACTLIREQRILHSVLDDLDEDENVYEIDEIAERIKKSFERCQIDFARNSQRTDATFIERLVRGEQHAYSEEEYQNKLALLKSKIQDLTKYHLISNIKLMEEYPAEKRDVLSLYLDDMENKLAAFNTFFNQISLYDKFVNNKGLSHKRMYLNRTDGMLILDDNSVSVPLNKMSSGEQNMLILYYNLIFKNNSRSILLIDEPENSLHVAWLTRMLADYKLMSEGLGCQILIATHSPAFINGNWDIAYDLEDKSYQG